MRDVHRKSVRQSLACINVNRREVIKCYNAKFNGRSCIVRSIALTMCYACYSSLMFVITAICTCHLITMRLVLIQDSVCMFLIHDPSSHAAGGHYLYTNRYHTLTATKHSLGKLVETPLLPQKWGEPLRIRQFDMLAWPTFLVRTLINNHLMFIVTHCTFLNHDLPIFI